MFNSIANQLVSVLPDEWEYVVMYSQFDESMYEIFFYVKVNGKYISCYDLDDYGISQDEVMECFDEIYQIFYPDYDEKKWFCATIRLMNDGKLTLDYDYNDDNIDEFDYREVWMKKYLPMV